MGRIDDLVKKISENTDYSEEDIKTQVKEKELEFSGLISNEGAAHIVAKELGVNLLEKKDVKIGDIVPDMNEINIIGKLVQKYDTKEFTMKNGDKGAVANVILADETGKIRVTLWNDQLNLLDQVNIGDVLQIMNGYTKEGYQGKTELSVGKRGIVRKSDKEIDVDTSNIPTGKKGERMNIKDCNVGDSVEFRAALVQVFENNPFFIKKDEENAQPKLVMNGVIDDGTANIRIVMFEEAVEQTFGAKKEEMLKISSNGINPKPVIAKYMESMGKEFLFKGYIKMNNFFERPEFIANSIEEVDPQVEAKNILNSLEGDKR